MDLQQRQSLADRLRKIAEEEAARGAADVAADFRRRADDVMAIQEAKRSSATVLGNPKHWLARAKEARAMAATIKDAEAERAMLDVAESYEKIAKRAEAREIGGIAVQPNKE